MADERRGDKEEAAEGESYGGKELIRNSRREMEVEGGVENVRD